MLNHDYRGKDYATNVLSFVYENRAADGWRPRHLRASVVAEAVAQRKSVRHTMRTSSCTAYCRLQGL